MKIQNFYNKFLKNFTLSNMKKNAKCRVDKLI